MINICQHFQIHVNEQYSMNISAKLVVRPLYLHSVEIKCKVISDSCESEIFHMCTVSSFVFQIVYWNKIIKNRSNGCLSSILNLDNCFWIRPQLTEKIHSIFCFQNSFNVCLVVHSVSRQCLLNTLFNRYALNQREKKKQKYSFINLIWFLEIEFKSTFYNSCFLFAVLNPFVFTYSVQQLVVLYCCFAS